jgi:hypothetical protein
MKYLLFLLFVFSFYRVNSLLFTINTTNTANLTNNITSEGLKCDLCHLGVSYIDNYLQNNHTETELENILDTLCYKIPDSSLCIGLVNNYLPQIIELIEKKNTPQEICNQLSLCDTHVYIFNDTHIKYNKL